MWNAEQNLLPIRFQPEPDELFSSWLMRLAMAHFLKIHTFSGFIFPKAMIWSKDIDCSLGDAQIEKIRLRTALTGERILATTLRGYEGKMYEKHILTLNPWLLPLGLYRFKRVGFGLQMCPHCLSEGEVPYFRRLWRVAWATVCLYHKIELLDRCPGCQSPIMFHRGDLGFPNQAFSRSMTQCSVCELNWTSPDVLRSLTLAGKSTLAGQEKLENVLNEGWGKIGEYGMVHSIAYFNGFRHLVKLLSVSRLSRKFREAVSRASGIDLIPERAKLTRFEQLSINERIRTLEIGHWLLENWNEKIVELAESANTFSKILNHSNEDLPYWFTSLVDRRLTRKTRSPTETEIRAAIGYLEKREKYSTILDLQKILGSNALISKTYKFRISIYQRLLKSNEAIEKRRVNAVRREAQRISKNTDKMSGRTARKTSKRYFEQNIKSPAGFIKCQNAYKNLIEKFQVRERLSVVKRMEETGNTELVKAEFGISRKSIVKWCLRYKNHGEAGLANRRPTVRKLSSQRVFDEQQEWIRTLHGEGLICSQIKAELTSRYNFHISETGLFQVMRKMDLALPFARKWKFGNKAAQLSLGEKSSNPKKIFAEQEKWIRDLHGEGLNYSQIRLELKRRYDFALCQASIREFMVKNFLYSPRSITKSKRVKVKSAGKK